MSSKRSRYSRSPSPSPYRQSDSRLLPRSRSISRSRSSGRAHRSRGPSIENPGNNLYVTGLSARVTKRDIEKHFSSKGKVEDINLVVDPWTRESRGFGFVTMSTVEEADSCVKHLDRSVLEGRVIMVEKAKRRRGRTPTPGRYLGLRTVHVRRRSPSYSPYPYHRSRSPRYSCERDRTGSPSPYYSRYRRGRFYSRSGSPYSRSPVSRHDRSYSPYESRHPYYSPDDYRYGRSCHYRSVSPMRRYSRSVSPWPRRSYSRSISPVYRRHSGRRGYSRNVSPVYRRRGYSQSISPPVYRRISRRCSRSISPSPRRSTHRGSSGRHGGYDEVRYSRNPPIESSPYSRSLSRSVTPRPFSPSP